MTVNAAQKMWSGDSGESELSDNFRYLDLTTSESYTVTCDPTDGLLDVLNAPDLPVPGQLYPGTTNVYAHKASATRISPVMWQVVVPYKGYLSSFPPAIVDWSNVTVEEEIEDDFDGNPILTEAFEPAEGVRALFCDPVATVRRNMLTYNSYSSAVYHRSVNSDTFLGWPPGTCKLMDLQAKDVKGDYYEVTGTFQFRIPYRTTTLKAWYARWRHEGYQRKLDAFSTTVIAPVVDGFGEPSSTKQLLDANGYQIIGGGGAATWKETKRYAPLPYNALGFAV